MPFPVHIQTSSYTLRTSALLRAFLVCRAFAVGTLAGIGAFFIGSTLAFFGTFAF